MNLTSADKSTTSAPGSCVRVIGVVGGSEAAFRKIRKGEIVLKVGDEAVRLPEELQAKIDASRDQKLTFVRMLVLGGGEKRWIGLELN